jgi:hypothetical protein
VAPLKHDINQFPTVSAYRLSTPGFTTSLLQKVPDRLVFPGGESPSGRRALWVAFALAGASRVASGSTNKFGGTFSSADSMPKGLEHKAPPDVVDAIRDIDTESFKRANPLADDDDVASLVKPATSWKLVLERAHLVSASIVCQSLLCNRHLQLSTIASMQIVQAVDAANKLNLHQSQRTSCVPAMSTPPTKYVGYSGSDNSSEVMRCISSGSIASASTGHSRSSSIVTASSALSLPQHTAESLVAFADVLWDEVRAVCECVCVCVYLTCTVAVEVRAVS